jgi:hypothetical protein
VKGIIEELAVQMIELTKDLRTFEACLVQWDEATTERTYIPRSARVICHLTHSKSLKYNIETL